MKIEKIITLANANARLQFLAMERSLRASGCRLPIWVIPYPGDRFDLPPNSEWWEEPGIITWLEENRMHAMMRKYQCLVAGSYHYVDADICFLKNPEQVLADKAGFITSCGHWRCPDDTVTAESRAIISAEYTQWERRIFNAGQFACDRPLYTIEALKAQAGHPNYRSTCIEYQFHDQPGVNLLVHLSGIKVTNLSLSDSSVQSTWAGDYAGDPHAYWKDEQQKPYLIHWAGLTPDGSRPVDKIFYDFLSQAEREEWELQRASQKSERGGTTGRSLRKLRRAAGAFYREWRAH